MAVQVCSDRTTMIMLIECWQWHGEQSPRYLHSAIRSSILSQQNVSAEWLNWPLLDTQEPEAPLCHITWANAHDLLLLYLVVSCLWIFLRKKKPPLSESFVEFFTQPSHVRYKLSSHCGHSDKSIEEDSYPFGQWPAVITLSWNYHITRDTLGLHPDRLWNLFFFVQARPISGVFTRIS